jgi:cytochrome c-type biogenesis protein CcmF
MPTLDVPSFGNFVLVAMLIAAGYTFGVSVSAGRGNTQHLKAARFGVLLTCALVALAVFVLGYAFQAHDFRIRYVSRYSDRSMPWGYLVTALWGGQDGSLLWWTFILSCYTTAAVVWIRNRYHEYQPWFFATLMSIFLFFGVLMLFAANPFALNIAGEPPDGEGLNPLLQNYWMAIHPPTLYSGLIGWSIPFAFCIAALISGRLDDEWITAVRKWTLFAWLALSVGNLLGMLWSYEELGWGGYWAWDPVENASFMPWLVGTAYIHSVMIQERRATLKVWNVFLMCLTFFMTIFGTFLTRSGLIASVHSFAKSDIGVYFAGYLVLLIVVIFGLIVWRFPKLRGEAQIDAVMSREFAFLMNNWILLGMMLFVLIATTFPLISEALRDETVTVGAGFYNKWMVPLGLLLLFLTGVGPLIAWKKASGKQLKQAFIFPMIAFVFAFALHFVVGPRIGYPPIVHADAIYDTATGKLLAWLFSAMPVLAFAMSSFVLASILQEFWRGTRARMRSADENPLVALWNLVWKARRRYGGYVVHLAIVMMFLGWTGAAYDVEKEAAILPGQFLEVGGYRFRYDGPRMERDEAKRMVFADMTVFKNGSEVGRVAPAKFIYTSMPDMPTTEVAIRTSLGTDLYVIMNAVNPETKLGTFKVIVRPFVAWIWIGGLVLILGAFVTMAPSIRELLGSAFSRNAKAALVVLGLVASASLMPANASADDSSSSLHAGHVEIHDARERHLFSRLLCMCGDCQRLPLDTCACGVADATRDEMRARLERGESFASIEESYRAQYGPKALAIPSDKGLDRALWAVPVVAILLAGAGLVRLARRWASRSAAQDAAQNAPTEQANAAEWDRKLDDELRKMDE